MKRLFTPEAPDIPAPFSQGIESRDVVHVATVPIHPDAEEKAGIDNRRANERIVEDDVRRQTGQVLDYVDAVLGEAGGSLDDVVKLTVFLVDVSESDAVVDVCAGYFESPGPVVSFVDVAELAHACRIEVDAVAVVRGD